MKNRISGTLWDGIYKGKITLSYEEKWLGEKRHEIIIRYLDKLCSTKIKFLEVGFGTGINLSLLKNSTDVEIFGVELSDEAIKFARKNLYGDFIRADVVNLPFKDDSLDLIYSAGLIEHFKDISKPLREMNRCVKNCGYIILTVPGYSFFFYYKLLGEIFGFWKLGYEKNFTVNSMKKECKKYGIGSIIEVGGIGALGLCFVSDIFFENCLII